VIATDCGNSKAAVQIKILFPTKFHRVSFFRPSEKVILPNKVEPVLAQGNSLARQSRGLSHIILCQPLQSDLVLPGERGVLGTSLLCCLVTCLHVTGTKGRA
jgi:hypothetical protein